MTSAIIVAAGRGTRMGPNIDKLFLEVAGQPVVAHTWAKFDSTTCVDEVVLVVRDGMEQAFREIAAKLGLKKPYRFAEGGAERQDSVWNGLQALSPESELVAIHDGARPCASRELIEQCVRAAKEFGGAVAAQRVTDTIKQSDDGLNDLSNCGSRDSLVSANAASFSRVCHSPGHCHGTRARLEPYG